MDEEYFVDNGKYYFKVVMTEYYAEPTDDECEDSYDDWDIAFTKCFPHTEEGYQNALKCYWAIEGTTAEFDLPSARFPKDLTLFEYKDGCEDEKKYKWYLR